MKIKTVEYINLRDLLDLFDDNQQDEILIAIDENYNSGDCIVELILLSEIKDLMWEHFNILEIINKNFQNDIYINI